MTSAAPGVSRALALLCAALVAAGCGTHPWKSDGGPPAVDTTVMVRIPAGTFGMGHPDQDFAPYGSEFKEDELPQHPVTLGEYYIDRDEVTVGAYAHFLDTYGEPRHFDPLQPITWDGRSFAPTAGADRQPIRFVDFDDAFTFCAFAGKTLPTEAEWERAARGPMGDHRFPWGDENPDCEHAVYLQGMTYCELAPVAVGSRSPKGDSPEGVHDLSGNVAEWVADYYGPFTADAVTDPTGPASGPYRVMRGGGFLDPGAAIRTTARWAADAANRGEGVGFRCAYRP